jgi:hypothetical protein
MLWPHSEFNYTSKLHFVSVLLIRYCAGDKNKTGGHVARMWRGEGYTGVWWGNLRERDHWGDQGVVGRIILRWIFRKRDVGVWTGLSWIRIGIGSAYL